MAGTLEITEELCWMPGNHFYDDILEQIAASVEGKHPELAARLLFGRAHVNGGYLDLRKSPADELGAILDAANLHLENVKATGPGYCYAPVFYPGYVRTCEELCDMLRVGLEERST